MKGERKVLDHARRAAARNTATARYVQTWDSAERPPEGADLVFVVFPISVVWP
jgi:hypothetical protein